jgi:F0F1-type ATP synthase membrane subunit b/b'
MFAFIFSFILIFAEGGHGSTSAATGGFTEIWNTYFNYPGFEAWKFINLAIFIAIMVYLLRKPLTDAFKAKRELIRAELIKAEEARQAALARLTEVEAKLTRLDTEAASLREKAAVEADLEKRRILEQTEADVNKLRLQAQNEIARISQQVKTELRRYSAEESIRLAEEKIKQEINPEKDARLVKSNIQSIGGLR